MEREVRQGEFYKHFKNKLYQIIAIATDSETREKMVVYQALYDDFKVYVRPYQMFVSEVDHIKYPEVKQKYRFEKCTVGSGIAMTEILPASSPDLEEGEISPLLLDFLECSTYEEKLDKFMMMKDKLDDRLLNDIAMSLDITVDSENLKEKFEEIKNCLMTFVHFEDNRMR
ncbi:DUF1653 domain-containing protein [Konateibacter massiliensis]|uniref:DUF1653 domain-containing protein n=1 Tax=Konateibacter massiliensis TaxID=2002841 RepID=UPI000C15EFD8|nr:DUF1653 domain-containing protein [Konateibacter massiliensis]